MTSAMTLFSEQWCAMQWLVNPNSGLKPNLSRSVSVFGLSERLIQKVKWPIAYVCMLSTVEMAVSLCWSCAVLYTARCRTACHNGGTCQRENQCRCPVGYTGNLCQRGQSSWTHPSSDVGCRWRRCLDEFSLLLPVINKHGSCPIQPDNLNPPLLRLTSRKPLWLDGRPATNWHQKSMEA